MHKLPSIDPLSYQPLREQVYGILRKAIITGTLQPGEPVTEVGIAEQLNVSRTPAREALRMLELEGLIVFIPRRGAFVAGINSKKEIEEIFQVRMVLEGLAASLAAIKGTDEQLARLREHDEQIRRCRETKDVHGCIKLDSAFHQLIYEMSENQWLQKLLDSLFEQITRFRSESLSDPARMEALLNEHAALIEVIANHDAVRAKEMAESHIRNACERVIAVYTGGTAT